MTAFTFWVIIQAARFFFKFSVFLPHRQRGQPKVEKGEGLIKPDKNRHSLPLFPLRFSPLDSPFLNPLFPLLCRFLPASFPDTQEGADPYQPVAGNYSVSWLSTETGSFPLYIRKCFTKSKCCCREKGLPKQSFSCFCYWIRSSLNSTKS